MDGRRWLVLVLGVVCSGFVGCRSARPAARDLAGAFCDLAWRCCSPGELAYFIGPYVAQDTCQERLLNSAELASAPILSLGAFGGVILTFPNLAVLDRAVSEGRTRVDNDALDACLAYLEGLPCNTVEEPPPPPIGCLPPPPPPEPNPCDEDLLFEGRVRDGGDCSSPGTTLECREGLVCRTDGPLGVGGACVEPGDVGAICFTDGECLPDLYCAQLDGTCRIPGEVGEVCAYADPEDPNPSPGTLLLECASGLSCDLLTDTCVAPCALGAACFFDDDCDEKSGLSCILGRCDYLHGLGLPCGADDDCEESLRCEPDPNSPLDEICTPRLADGEMCFFDTDCLSDFCDVGTCAPQAPAGSVCSSSSECMNGYCETMFIPCTMDPDCAATSGVCDTVIGQCEWVCVSFLADGEMCSISFECSSAGCVAGFCRTLPLADGVECEFGFQCESGFCNLDTPNVCAPTPLANGELCVFGSQCESLVCWAPLGDPPICVPGGTEGDPCDDPSLVPPCDPAELYCDFGGAPTICVPYVETGDTCENASECRGNCTLAFSRMMCDPTPPPEEAVCDGPAP